VLPPSRGSSPAASSSPARPCRRPTFHNPLSSAPSHQDAGRGRAGSGESRSPLLPIAVPLHITDFVSLRPRPTVSSQLDQHLQQTNKLASRMTTILSRLDTRLTRLDKMIAPFGIQPLAKEAKSELVGLLYEVMAEERGLSNECRCCVQISTQRWRCYQERKSEWI
jgi:hypothetical protein